MEPKEKAIKLFKSFLNIGDLNPEDAKQCALIAVDEIIEFIADEQYYKDYNYLQQVKEEINKL